MSIEAQNIEVNQDVQEHYIIYDREITPNPDPQFNNNILVTWDNRSNRLYFNMYYTFDDRTLKDKEICVVWINANGDKGMSLCEDVTLENDRLYFSWNVPIEATYCAGIINFAVHITTDNYIWNSLAGSVEVKKGLITEEFNNLEEAKLKPGWVDYIEGKYKLYLVKLTQTEYAELEEKKDTALYLVLQDDGSIKQYLGETLISGGSGESHEEVNVSVDTYGIISAPDNFLQISVDDNDNATKINMIVKAGTKVKIPDGFNADNSRKYIEYEFETDTASTADIPPKPGRAYIVLTNGGVIMGFNTYIISYHDNEDNHIQNNGLNTAVFIYRINENKSYILTKPTSSSTPSYALTNGVVIGYIDFNYTYDTSSSSVKFVYNKSKVFSKSTELVNSDTFYHFLEQKPGICVNGDSYVGAFGPTATKDCIIFNDTESMSNKIGGNYNTIFGTGNSITNGEYQLIIGDNNTLATVDISETSQKSNVIIGNQNLLKGGSSQYNYIFGQNNTIDYSRDSGNGTALGTNGQAFCNLISGSKHSIFTNSYHNIIGGTENLLHNDESSCSLIVGSKNVINNTTYSTVSGYNNVIYKNSSYCIIGGRDNVATNGVQDSLIIGDGNILPYTYQSIIGGDLNKSLAGFGSIGNTVYCVKGGTGAKQNGGITNSFIGGAYHTYTDSIYESIVQGNTNKLGNMNSCIIGGALNEVCLGSYANHTIVCGQRVYLRSAAVQSLAIGLDINIIPSLNMSIVGGDKVTATGNSSISQSIVCGMELSINGGTYASCICGSDTNLVTTNNSNVITSDTVATKEIYCSSVTGSNHHIDRQINSCIIGGSYNTTSETVPTGGTASQLHSSIIVGTQLKTSSLSVTNNNFAYGYSVFGKFNVDEDKIFIVGNGTSDNDRKNAMTIDHNNNMTVGGTVSITDSADGTVIDLLAKIKELEQRISALES